MFRLVLAAVLTYHGVWGTRPARHSLEKILEDVQAMQRAENRFRHHFKEREDNQAHHVRKKLKVTSRDDATTQQSIAEERMKESVVRRPLANEPAIGRLGGFHQLDLSDEGVEGSQGLQGRGTRTVDGPDQRSGTPKDSAWQSWRHFVGRSHWRIQGMVLAWMVVAAVLTLALLCCCNFSLLTMAPRK
mmetsp:Transcript_19253/g.32421  ORF Transcript_19253/g.32421 Transcript_19253/m.32421 type:complete len:188 (-) Transcript_19253:35-598(-)